MLVFAQNIENNAVYEADLCIIGSGPAAISIALEFLKTNVSVVMLTGGVEREISFNQDLHRGFSSPAGSHEPLEENRRRAFGGASVAWGGRCIPLDEIDFKHRDWVADSGWPFDYKEIAPYYEAASALCDIGVFDFDALSTFPSNPQKEILEGMDNENIISSRLERWSTPVNFAKRYRSELETASNIKVLLNTHLTNIDTDENGESVSYIIACVGEKMITVKASNYVLACGGIETPRLLLASKNAKHPYGIGNNNDVVGRYYMAHFGGIHSKVAPTNREKIIFNFERDKEQVYCRRRWWVTDKFQKEKKIGNIIFFLLHSQDQEGHRDVLFSITFLVKFFLSILKERSFKKAKEHKVALWEHGKIVMYEGWKQLPSIILIAFKRFQKRRLPMVLPNRNSPYLGLYYQAEQTPCRESRVRLSNEVKDAMGVPRVIVEFKSNELDKKTIVEAHKLFVEQYKKADLGVIHFDESKLLEQIENKTKHFNSAAHHIGTTRMSVNAKKGVVDVNCKVHGIDNLYIAGSSIFPTGGHINPTLTLVALAVRLGKHLKTITKH
jgi:choline dehydrogenase-like flavoprotein